MQLGLKTNFDKRCFHVLSKLPTKKSYNISLLKKAVFLPRFNEILSAKPKKIYLLLESLSESDQLIKAIQLIQSLFSN
jgi:hypothetical protein